MPNGHIGNVRLLNKETVTLRTQASGSRDALGGWVSEEGKDVDIIGSIQPLSGKDYLLLPERDRQKQVLTIYTKTELVYNDLIIRERQTYEVNQIESWYGFYKALLYRRSPA